LEDKTLLRSIKIVTIVGKGRSGTTLLQFILDGHPNIIAPPEALFFLHLRRKYSRQNWTENTYSSFARDLQTERGFRDNWKIEPSLVVQYLKHYHVDNFIDAIKATYLATCPDKRSTAKWIVLKGPRFTLFLDQLIASYPQMHFIHLVRDPRANALSHQHHLYRFSLPLIASKWVSINQQVEHIVTQDPGKATLLIYEKLVSFPEETIRLLSAFLDVPYLPAMLNQSKKTKRLQKENPAFFRPLHQNTLHAINTNSIDKWRSDFSPDEIAKIERCTFPYAKRYGYLPIIENHLDSQPFSTSISIKLGLIYYFMRMVYLLPFKLRSYFFKIAKREETKNEVNQSVNTWDKL